MGVVGSVEKLVERREAEDAAANYEDAFGGLRHCEACVEVLYMVLIVFSLLAMARRC